MIQTILNYLYRFFLLNNRKNIKLFGKVQVKNKPCIDIKDDALLELGKNVTLNSKNEKYHLNMFTSVKLYADRKGSKIKIGDNTRIHGSCLHAYEYIEIGKNCLIAANCQIFDGSGHDVYLKNASLRIKTIGKSKLIIIGDNCWIGTNCIILPGTILGNNCVIGAGSVVRGKFGNNLLISGNPAESIKSIEV